jgi:NADPH:quinone reductase-like Zn-dependent oxidoreductase
VREGDERVGPESNRRELVEIARLIASGSLEPILSRVFPLQRARKVFALGCSNGRGRGKIVLQA